MKETWECMVYIDKEKDRFALYEIVLARDGKTIAQINFESDEYEMPKLDGAELVVFFKEITLEEIFKKAKTTKDLAVEDKVAIRLIKNNFTKTMESQVAGIALYRYKRNADIEDDFDLLSEIERLKIQNLADLQLDKAKEVIAHKDYMRANDDIEFNDDISYIPINKVF